jgi:hypothetical protein
VLLCGALLSCQGAAPPPALPPALPPPQEPAPLSASLELGWGERDQVAAKARALLQAQARDAGLRRVEDVQVALRCHSGRCTAQITGTALP